jgi:hypothetical protein
LLDRTEGDNIKGAASREISKTHWKVAMCARVTPEGEERDYIDYSIANGLRQ